MIYRIGLIVGAVVAFACAIPLTVTWDPQPTPAGVLAPYSAPAKLTTSVDGQM